MTSKVSINNIDECKKYIDTIIKYYNVDIQDTRRRSGDYYWIGTKLFDVKNNDRDTLIAKWITKYGKMIKHLLDYGLF